MLSVNADLPNTLRVRTPQGDAKLVAFAPMQVLNHWVIRGLLSLILMGCVAAIYLIVIAVRAIIP
jgi:hypothetical protein